MRSKQDRQTRTGVALAGKAPRLSKWLVSPILIPVALAACGERGGEAAAPERPPVPVVVAPVRVADVPIFAEFTGRLEAYSTIELIARVEGVLVEQFFDEGDEVQPGDVLFKIDDRPFQASVDEADAALAKANADLRLAQEQVQVRAAEAALAQSQARLKRAVTDESRLKPLAEIDAVPRQDLDNAVAAVEVAQAEVDAQEATLENTRLTTEIDIARGEAAVASAEASLDQARILLGFCTIEAPIDGWIGKVAVDVGNVVGRPGMTDLATVRKLDPIYADFAISEASYLAFSNRLRPQADDMPTLELILADGSVWPEPGRFLFAERYVDRSTGTITVRGEFPNPDDFLRPGMFGRIRGKVEDLANALVIPRRAIMQRQTTRYVYVVGEGDRVQQRTIELGPDYGSDVVVTSGLAAGDRIVVEGLQKIAPGVRVAPTEMSTTSEPAAASGGGG
jgi:membrane fusion protein (multidrug efflux system)